MTRKKKAVRKPAPVEMPETLLDRGGCVLANCVQRMRGDRRIVIYADWPSPAEARRLADWLLRAAAWVEGGRR